MIVPRKLGLVLGEEMLLLARKYRGEELKQRGVPFPVYPRVEVMDQALEMARELAEKPRISLVTLKRQLTRSLREELPEVVKQEVAMHDKTFHQPEVRENIRLLFGK
jgi:polyketide biosynthesis enoyl-CoA hydratase PksI